MRITPLLFILLTGFLSGPFTGSLTGQGIIGINSAAAEVYMHTDENGKVSFTDRPSPAKNGQSIEKIDIQETNTSKAITPQQHTSTSNSTQSSQANYQLNISSPADGDTFTNETRSLTVSADISPAPTNNKPMNLVLIDNGERVDSQSSNNSSFTLDPLTRGEHQLQVQLINNSGDIIKRSQVVTINVHHTSAPIPAPRPKPKPKAR